MSLVGLAGLGGLFGCSSTPAHSDNERAWPFRPVAMRIHPLTRFVEPDEFGPVIEVHLEFSDIDGYDTRAVGEVLLRLTARGSAEIEPLEWTIDLDNLALNTRHYRAVTRTYEIPVSVRWPEPPRGSSVVLEVIHDDGLGAPRRSAMTLDPR